MTKSFLLAANAASTIAVTLIAALALTILFPSAAHAEGRQPAKPPVQDTWTGSDKLLHLGAGTVIGFVGTRATESPLLGFGMGCGVGVGKELIDPRFSSKDAIVTCLGAAAGAWLGGWSMGYDSRTGTTTVSYSTSF